MENNIYTNKQLYGTYRSLISAVKHNNLKLLKMLHQQLNITFSSIHTSNCNFYNNNIGIKPFDYSEVHIENCNFVDNITYGLGIISEHPIVTINYSNSGGCENGDYWENCPG